MRPAEFTPEEIIQAGQELQAAGRNITGFALRQKVGGGNPSRLKQVWDEHQAGQSVAHSEPVAELPVEVADEVAHVSKQLTDRLAALAVELNDKAVKAADRRVAEVVRSAGEQREQAERELADAAQTVDDLETKLDEAGTENERLEKRLVDLQEGNQAQAVELAQLRERLAATEQHAHAAAEQHAAALADLRGQLEDLQTKHQGLTDTYHERAGELMAANAAAAREGEFRRRAEDELRVAAERLAELEKTSQAQAGELATVKANADANEAKHQEQRKTAAAEAHRAAERMTKAESERDTARQEAGAAREDAAKLRGQVETLQIHAAELLKALGGKANPEKAAK